MSLPAPKASVVLRTFGHAKFVAQAIESVLIQRVPFAFELVIGEDCSTDGTREIVVSYAERHPEAIRTVLPERNLGHGEILRRAMEEARAPLIAYLDGDDYWTSPHKLHRQVEYLERHRECASCFHDASLVYDAAGTPSGSVSPGFAESRFGLDDIVKECFVPAPSMVFRREVLGSLPEWAFESAWIDWLLHIGAAAAGPLGYIPEPLGAYRVHRGGMFSALDRSTQLEEDLRFYARLLPELPRQRDLIERCMDYRRCQLAIERLGVPFEAGVVLVDPRHELRPYFNGRHARGLPRREGHEVTELEAIRRAATDLPAAVRDYGGPAQASEGGGRCYVVVPAAAADWLAASPLADHLAQHGNVVARGEWGAIHEVPRLGGGGEGRRALRHAEVSLREPLPEPLAGGHLEAPAGQIGLPAHAVPLSGWVLGRERPVVALEARLGDELVWRAPVDVERPDIVAAFPQIEVAKPGFRTTLNACELPEEAALELVAVLAGGESVAWVDLRLLGAG